MTMMHSLWIFLSLIALNGCTHAEIKTAYSMDDLLNMPTEKLMNLTVENTSKKKK